MALPREHVQAGLLVIEQQLAQLPAGLASAEALERYASDSAALRFHLSPHKGRPPIVCILGGTGTGKSTLVNRLLEGNVSAASHKRTFTSGAVAIARDADTLPADWMGVPHGAAQTLPERGQGGRLAVVARDTALTQRLTLVDTPDLDGDAPAHHAEADRAFRWAQGIIFLVTPEKYQMTELLAYLRLASRYDVPSLFVMNKAEEQGAVDDWRLQLAQRGWKEAHVFAMGRDDSAFEPSAGAGIESLRDGLPAFMENAPPANAALAVRAQDVLGRLRDQVLAPLREARREVDRLIPTLRALDAPGASVDVRPLTVQLQRRLQEQSVLYLMGPARMLERVRQAPGMILRLPRTLWDVIFNGRGPRLDVPRMQAGADAAPDFSAILSDQFTIVQSRIDDILRTSPAIAGSMDAPASDYRAQRIPPAEAARIAEEELAELNEWLRKRWNASPRDTMLLHRLLKYLPGGKKLAAWSEAAPYLLALVVATHHAFFGPIDLMVVGGFSLATWISEKLSNEVTNRARQANRRMEARFLSLAHDQIGRACAWIETQALPQAALAHLEGLLADVWDRLAAAGLAEGEQPAGPRMGVASLGDEPHEGARDAGPQGGPPMLEGPNRDGPKIGRQAS